MAMSHFTSTATRCTNKMLTWIVVHELFFRRGRWNGVGGKSAAYMLNAITSALGKYLANFLFYKLNTSLDLLTHINSLHSA